MPDGQLTLTPQQLKTPRAAALAVILFAVLFGSSVVLIRLAVPANPADGGVWLQDRAGTVSLALSLLPFAGIAFLWFMGLVSTWIFLLLQPRIPLPVGIVLGVAVILATCMLAVLCIGWVWSQRTDEEERTATVLVKCTCKEQPG